MDEEGAKRERMEVESRLVFGAEIGSGAARTGITAGIFVRVQRVIHGSVVESFFADRTAKDIGRVVRPAFVNGPGEVLLTGMSFPQTVKDAAMVACERHCCLCHQFKGTKIQWHHIVPRADSGEDTFENCIPLCFDCHAEVEAYNPKHPKGTKHSANELKQRRDAWYQEVRNRRTLRDSVRPSNEPIELESFEEARSMAEMNPTDKTNLRRGVVRGWQLLAKGV